MELLDSIILQIILRLVSDNYDSIMMTTFVGTEMPEVAGAC